MIEQLINFETAKLAKEKGFNLTNGALDYNTVFDEIFEPEYRPTQSLLAKWLREKHNIIVIIDYSFIDDSEDAYHWKIIRDNPKSISDFDRLLTIESFSYEKMSWYETFEEALEEGLKEALKLLPDK